jgi:hypothetical protein
VNSQDRGHQRPGSHGYAPPQLPPAPGAAPHQPYAPFPAAPLYGPPEPPSYREARPVRSGAALAGFAGGLLWFLLITAVAWNLWLTIAGLVAATAAVAVLAWWGDRGVAAGLATVVAIVGSVVTLAVWL